MSSAFQVERTRKLLVDLKGANTEAAKKERFGQYLTLTFAGDPGAQAVISKIALGAEKLSSIFHAAQAHAPDGRTVIRPH